MADIEYKRLTVGGLRLNLKPEKQCCIDGCERPRAGRGWCHAHWGMWKKYGDPLGRTKPVEKMAARCEAPECIRESRSRWNYEISLCTMHYARMANSGTLDNPRGQPTPDGLCVEPGCIKQTRSRLCQHCEQHYYQIRRTGSAKTKNDMSSHAVCMQCGAANAGESNKYCGDKCAARFKAGVENSKPCAVCSIAFFWNGKSICCSESCKAELKRRYGRAWYAKGMATSDLFKAKVRNAEYKRKALKRSAFIEDVDRNSVMLRDKWMCHLCGEKIPRNEVWPKPLFGSLDHVVPLARGGTHCYGNVKAAHLRCNVSKGAKTIGQLGFVFGDVKS